MSGQADEGGGRGDPYVFVLGCESMLVRQATRSVNMTRPLKHRPLHSVEPDLCVCVCRSSSGGNTSVFISIYNRSRSCSSSILA